MPKLLRFRTAIYDSYQSLSEMNNLFNKDHINGENETKMTEDRIVKWIIGKSKFRELLFSELHLPFDTKVHCHKKEPFIKPSSNNNPGDIDILLINPERPKESIAIECKKVNVTINREGNEIVNKINKIKVGVKQTKGLLEMGFHKIYLMILIASYGAEYKSVDYSERRVSPDNFQKLYDFHDRDNLKDKIGLIFVEIIQPTGSPLKYTGGFGVCIDKFAKPQDQTNSITEKIKQHL